ncbi:LOW QUALITY PROTEIN: Uncharacterized protein PHPALM_63 [Phytophthora palmivora]|uniref:Retroviral polymerase SH3-like domain-containing protein n=1 Tax=Phytophthora palmivora TaxID=4796 RepID=A0A2P4YVT0_9STRA|nr:LOW QUALITY PROTEIN: Uncharacterized protein PHPALM_63 [Phytophthora palmivora]
MTLINLTPSSTTSDRIPYELRYNRIPSKQYIKLCTHLGIPDHKKGYRLMDLDTHAIIYSRDVIFKEDEYPPLTNLTDTPDQPSNESVQRTQTQTLAPVPAVPVVQLSATQRLQPPFKDELDRTELHYSFRTTNPSSPPDPKRPSLNADATEVTLNSEEDLQEQEQCQQLLHYWQFGMCPSPLRTERPWHRLMLNSGVKQQNLNTSP